MPEHNSGNVFPRAAFGLPITFEFRGSPGDPQKLELHPEGGSDRMASPLILRPYWNGKTWQAAALLLPEWEKALNQPLKFKGQDGYKPTHWPADAKTRQEKARHIKPMMKGNELRADDPLSAFMHYFEKGL
jgi:CRISPR-associated protein Cmr1